MGCWMVFLYSNGNIFCNFLQILNCCWPDHLWLHCITRNLSWGHQMSGLTVLTSLHHLQDEELMLRTDTHKVYLQYPNLFAGISPFGCCQTLTELPRGAVEQFGCFTKIRLALFSPHTHTQMYRNLMYFPDEWLAPCALPTPSQFESAIGHDCNWCSLHGHLQCIVNQLL